MQTTESMLITIKEKLHSAGYKLTPQREATIKILLEKETEHMSAEEIYLAVKKKNSDIGLATVYRTLEILSEMEVVNKISFDDGLVRYDLKQEGDRHFHHHLLCLKCGGIEEIFEDLLETVEQDVEKRFNFQIKDHRLTFHGICKKCQ
ncbi:Fur family transcriptional regulator [Carnobacterium funditum]|uniref:ferric iron uptake transcriptional regulator n=1 Tax=Carnobacterium funditum TaxID=2752 RepID=UPI000552458D|nr:Fur family transcriptional regulator [Carnobacterium funditum]